MIGTSRELFRLQHVLIGARSSSLCCSASRTVSNEKQGLLVGLPQRRLTAVSVTEGELWFL